MAGEADRKKEKKEKKEKRERESLLSYRDPKDGWKSAERAEKRGGGKAVFLSNSQV